jgi:DNA helicase-2/ATP-dependent DNA helicase PcrA
LPDRIVQEELELLSSVRETLAQIAEPETPPESGLVQDLHGIRDQLLDGAPDPYDQTQLTLRFHVQSSVLDQLRKSRQSPRVDHGSPYFAHLRLRENGRVRDLCIGKATRLDHGLRIVDWRNAPIAQLFYRYQQGDEYEEEISGRTQTGNIEARRTVTIRSGRLERVEAPEGVFVPDASAPDGWRVSAKALPRLAGGEGAALRVQAGEGGPRRLGTDPSGRALRADKRLPDIAGLIDAAQFDLITRPSTGLLVIRGAAGSGKTTVALHRIAFLAYDDPRIDSSATLFVVFSPGLRDYVSHVLPALGASHVAVRTFHQWSREVRRRHFPQLPERVREDTPALVARLKLHPALEVALERQVARAPGAPSRGRAIDDWLSVLGDLPFLREVFGEVAPEAWQPGHLEEAVSHCRNQIEAMQAHLAGDRSAEAELDPEDDALLLRAWQLRNGPLLAPNGEPLRLRHIAIDEVQDFSPLEVRVLIECADERRSVTLAGDTQQHVMQAAGFSDWAQFFRHLGLAAAHVDTLQISYRSSAEITRFAMELLGPLREKDLALLTTRSGPPVEIFHYTEHGACIASLADALHALASEESLASVAVLTPTRELSELYYRGLAQGEVPRLRWVQQQNFAFTPGVEVTEIDQVKGLEYDYVVLVGCDLAHFPSDAKSRRLLHVGATRAVHQLWVTCVGEPSPIVEEAARACARGGAAEAAGAGDPQLATSSTSRS